MSLSIPRLQENWKTSNRTVSESAAVRPELQDLGGANLEVSLELPTQIDN